MSLRKIEMAFRFSGDHFGSANGRQHYNIALSLIGLAQTQNDPCFLHALQDLISIFLSDIETSTRVLIQYKEAILPVQEFLLWK